MCGRRGVSVCMYMYERVCVHVGTSIHCTCRCKHEKKWYLKYCICCHVQCMYHTHT